MKPTDCSLEQLDQRTPSDPESRICKDQTAETETAQLSFAEVMQLVQAGKEVPGAIKLDIKPSNQSPTPSRRERIMKPWETMVCHYSSGLQSMNVTGSPQVLVKNIEY
uniref:Peroxisomal membrane protein PEX14-like KPWE domain-containing protein n=1 Tax=Anabas testudineus TaxID=64144 RepID=A0A3Q1JUH2_ANATE